MTTAASDAFERILRVLVPCSALVVLLLMNLGPGTARADHVIPGSSLTVLYIQEDRFFNWDFSDPSVIANYTVDWPITMLFFNNAEIDKVKDTLGLGRCGSAEYAWLKDSTATPLDRDEDGGITSDCTNCSGTRNHMRLYADSDDRLYNLSWGYYVLGTTHQDHNTFPDCFNHDWSGETEDAQWFFTQKAAEKYGWPSVSYNSMNFYNPVSYFVSGNHRVESDGLATYVYVASDLATWRPTSLAREWDIRGKGKQNYGEPGDRPVPHDYTGDRLAELAYWTNNDGVWHVFGVGNTQWGLPGDTPVPCDYNGDGRAEYAVWRPTGNPGFPAGQASWYVYGGVYNLPFGLSGDIPVPADYNGDGRCDIAVWRPTGNYGYPAGQASYYVYGGVNNLPFGLNGDVPVPADYDMYPVGTPGCDGRSDYAVWRPTGNAGYGPTQASWYVYGGPNNLAWGLTGDKPVARDYNGGACADYAVWRPSNAYWYIRDILTTQFGPSGADVQPVPQKY